ncbi:hypothetical protein GALMADRAFT_270824 [Galerina marginata CBS 339.88]|uniref:Uncharacterized protein n=1 Tax=Galerina marginata (strain CBS 339.88) TaxID=685588 RepID=A0A067SM53_GALM3|nr:hypothetical protein GALMADRAFT_270824 [Galerina marginata CBS 339.88]
MTALEPETSPRPTPAPLAAGTSDAGVPQPDPGTPEAASTGPPAPEAGAITTPEPETNLPTPGLLTETSNADIPPSYPGPPEPTSVNPPTSEATGPTPDNTTRSDAAQPADSETPAPSSASSDRKKPHIVNIHNSYNVTNSRIVNSFQNRGDVGRNKEEGSEVRDSMTDNDSKREDTDAQTANTPSADYPGFNYNPTWPSEFSTGVYVHPLTGQTYFQTSTPNASQPFPQFCSAPYTHHVVNTGHQGMPSNAMVHNVNSGNVRTINYTGESRTAPGSQTINYTREVRIAPGSRQAPGPVESNRNVWQKSTKPQNTKSKEKDSSCFNRCVRAANHSMAEIYNAGYCAFIRMARTCAVMPYFSLQQDARALIYEI